MSWDRLREASWRRLRASWGRLGRVFGRLGGNLGGKFGPSWDQFQEDCIQKRSTAAPRFVVRALCGLLGDDLACNFGPSGRLRRVLSHLGGVLGRLGPSSAPN